MTTNVLPTFLWFTVYNSLYVFIRCITLRVCILEKLSVYMFYCRQCNPTQDFLDPRIYYCILTYDWNRTPSPTSSNIQTCQTHNWKKKSECRTRVNRQLQCILGLSNIYHKISSWTSIVYWLWRVIIEAREHHSIQPSQPRKFRNQLVDLPNPRSRPVWPYSSCQWPSAAESCRGNMQLVMFQRRLPQVTGRSLSSHHIM